LEESEWEKENEEDLEGRKKPEKKCSKYLRNSQQGPKNTKRVQKVSNLSF